MESFNYVKRGYNPEEVDAYIGKLEEVIKSYKEKDNAIKNAIISAQVTADNIVKNAHLQASEYKKQVIMQLKKVYESVGEQRSQIQSFQEDYNKLVSKYLTNIKDGDLAAIFGHVNALEQYILSLGDLDEINGDDPTV